MKFSLVAVLMLFMLNAKAESLCDVRPGTSVGVKVIEFASGNVIHSKMPFKETTPDALLEEMINLQDMGVCEEKIVAQKCSLKFEKFKNTNFVSLLRGNVKWSTWNLSAKSNAEKIHQELKESRILFMKLVISLLFILASFSALAGYRCDIKVSHADKEKLYANTSIEADSTELKSQSITDYLGKKNLSLEFVMDGWAGEEHATFVFKKGNNQMSEKVSLIGKSKDTIWFDSFKFDFDCGLKS